MAKRKDSPMNKIDLRKQYREYYSPSSKSVSKVDIPEFKFLMIDGKIEAGASPGTSPSFKLAMEALYGVAYALKFMSKLRQEHPIDYNVMGLEALWWIEQGIFDIARPDNWCWTAMILQPDHITSTMVREAQVKVTERKQNSKISDLRIEKFQEGLCIQIMHIGPYATEPMSVNKMEEYALQNGYVMHSKHHEIYLGNPLRSAPEKLKTILRHPIEPVQAGHVDV
jgi:hypothetical protein